jgi:hypothetical protein
VEDTDAVLYVAASPGDLSVTLSRLKEQEAKEVLRELLFRMADSLTHLNNTGEVRDKALIQRTKFSSHTVLFPI